MMALSPIQLTQELIRFQTVNPPGDERPCAEYLAGLLESAGFAVELVPFGEGRAQLLARIGGGARPPLAFTGHLDTVPLGAQPWSNDPFAGDIKDGKLFGRGSSDMKSGVAAFVSASISLAPRLAGTPGIFLIITAGEETGCTGALSLAGAGKSLGPAGALVVAEPTGNKPLIGHKGALWLEAETRGVTAHGSMPDKGVNAIYKVASAISALAAFDFNVARHGVLGAPTLNVGTVHGGLNINSVPDRAVIGVDIRSIPAQSHADIRGQLASYLGSEVKLRTMLDVHGVWSDPANIWIREMFETTRNVTGAEYEIAGAPYFTDASALAPALGSPPTMILGPGEISLAHMTDEYCLTERIDQAAEIYAQTIRNWCRL